jgi:hypothetical protein
VLAEVRPLMKRSDDRVFPSGGQCKPLSDTALSGVVRRMNEGFEDGALPRWREGQAVVRYGVGGGGVGPYPQNTAEAAYAWSDLLEKRRPLMEAWGGPHCFRLPAAVMALAE